jgi:DnaJ family protein A protein 2
MPSFKLYERLGLQRGASAEQIKSAYRKLAIQNHPDKGGKEEDFKEISAAYNVLADDDKRNEYNQVGDEGISGGHNPSHDHHHHFNPHDIFAQMFSGMGMGMGMHNRNRPSNKKRHTHVHELHIPLHEAYFGSQRGLKVQLEKQCFSCISTCPACQGLGQITQMMRNGPFTQIAQVNCDVCSGSGSISKGSNSCSICKGKCTYTEDKKVDIPIKKGVPTRGYEVTVNEAGEQAKRQHEVSGDLIIKVVVDTHDKHKRFQRYGSDGTHLLLIDPDLVHITFVDSIFGKDMEINHFSGRINLNTLSSFGIIEPGKSYIVPGKGMPIKDTHGDLVIKFNVAYPSKETVASLKNEDMDALKTLFKSMNL